MLKLFPDTPEEIRARIRALLLSYIRTYRERRQLWNRYHAELNQTAEQGDRAALYWYTCDAEAELTEELDAVRCTINYYKSLLNERTTIN
jgi:hypothetical protein